MKSKTEPMSPAACARRALAGLGALALLAGAAACRQDMHNQPRYKPLAESDFFADGKSARPLPAGTVARGLLHEDRVLATGVGPDGVFVREIPVPVDRALLDRGRDRFNVFCSPCHGQTGGGAGMIVLRGFKQPEPYWVDRLRAQPIGYFFDVMTNGFGQMSAYADKVGPEDRWAIAAYIRVLQVSQRATAADLPARDRGALESLPPGGVAPGPPAEKHQ